MIVHDAHRPARGKAVSKPDAGRAAPPGVGPGGANDYRCGDNILETGGGYCAAAFHIQQRIAPGITDLSGEKPERVDPRAVGCIARNGKEKCIADLGASQAGPIALRLKPEHPRVALRAITKLPAGSAARRIVAAFRGNECVGGRYQVPAVAARPPAAVGSPIEARPVIDGG